MFTNKKIISLIIMVMLVISFSACSPVNEKQEEQPQEPQQATNETTYPLTITDSHNREVNIEREPTKIVSVAPNITETIFALEESEKLIGRTDFCDYPEKVKNIESIGSLTEPNIEKIADLKPDLIIASTHFNEDVLKKLEELGLKVIVLYGEESFDGVYNVIGKIGKILNAKSKADKIISDMKVKVTNVQEKVKDVARPSVYYVVGFGEYGDFTAGKDTFINQMIEIAGGKNAADDVEGWKYSLERLIEKDPDILICSMSGNEKKQIMSANGYKDLTAVKEGKLFEIDKNLLERQGPRLADGIEALAKIIHPELFK